jgi:hypothetical protein
MRSDTRLAMIEALRHHSLQSREMITETLPISIISVNDDMFHGDPVTYFRIGIEAERIVTSYLSNKTNPRILLLPSGHGRETRFIKGKYPEANLIACDLEIDAVEFCETVLGCTPLLSNEKFSEVDFPKECDVIWMGSLITHISETRAIELISILIGSLKVGGSLVFSSHGDFVASILKSGPNYGIDSEGTKELNKDYELFGYGYSNYPGQDNYGISVIKPIWFQNFVSSLTVSHSISIKERFWDNHHDVIAITLL